MGHSVNGNDYLTVTAHWIDENCYMQKKLKVINIVKCKQNESYIAQTI